MEIDLHQANAQLSRLIERAMAGEEIVIVEKGRAVARIVPVNPENSPGDRDAESEMADLFADALGG